MPDRSDASLDVLAIGELLVDLIGEEPGKKLSGTERFTRFQGGSAANLTRTLALIGMRAALVASVGSDGFGTFLRDELSEAGVNTEYIHTIGTTPTSLVVISRTAATAEFAAYRHADAQIHPDHVPDAVLTNTTVFHTTCFALSRPPGRSTILDAAERASAQGCLLTLDANYAPAIWADRLEAQSIIELYCRHGAFVKMSEDDVTRLYADDLSPEETADRIHGKGATLLCLTLGEEGSFVSWENATEQVYVPAPRVDNVVDATGAGDVFWAGFVAAHIAGHRPETCARVGSALTARKIQHAGPLRQRVTVNELLEDVEHSSSESEN